MPRPDEGLIHAWLDGELTPEESARVERLVAEDAEWAAAAAEARGLVAASSRILTALDDVPAGVMPAGSRAAPARGRFSVRPWMRVAAGLVLVAGTAYLVTDRTGTPTIDNVMIASEMSAERAPDVAAPAPTATAPTTSASTPTTPTIGARREDRVAEPAPAAVVTSQPAAPERHEVANAALADAARGGAPAELGAAVATPLPAPAGAAAPAPPPPMAVERELARAEADRRAEPLRARAAARQAEPEQQGRLAQRAQPAQQGFAAKALSVAVLDGCWRTTTSAGADSLLTSPVIVEARGDTIAIAAGPAARPASVVRVGTDRLQGEMADARGVRVPFTAERVACPPARPPGDDATPSPRR